MKKYIIIAGVNGAGKSTLYYLNSSWTDLEKINLDEIVREIGSWKCPEAVFTAGRIIVNRINECLENGVSFCQETTLCGKTILKNIQKAKELGYYIEVHYVGLDSAELAKKRVQHRVSVGGHGIDEKDIERRYIESLRQLQKIIYECDLVVFYDNTYSFNRFAIAKYGELKRINTMNTLPRWYTKAGFEREVNDFIFKDKNLEIVIEYDKIDFPREHLYAYHSRVMWYEWKACEIMHGNEKVATVCKDGTCVIHSEEMLPYNIYLEEAGESANIDIRLQNLDNFYHWCAARTLPSERKYSKEILNSINASHEETDKERAIRALWYNCLSLTDIYWAKAIHQRIDFADINLYDNYSGNPYISIGLRGEQVVVEDSYSLAGILGTQGCFPKAWIKRNGQLFLVKGGTDEDIEKELLASKICSCFYVNQVRYESILYEGKRYATCKIMTSTEYSIVPMEHFWIYLANQELDMAQTIFAMDSYNYYMMNIVDYLVGNIDRHWGNWGVLVDNSTNKPIRLHDLMDFNRAFGEYDTLEGANCLTTYLVEKKQQTQKEAALEAINKVGLNQIAEVDEVWFNDESVKNMFFERLRLLKRELGEGIV